MEKLDIYNKNREKTGRTAVRGERLESGECHLAAKVCVFNNENKLLIQQRQPFKSRWANMWDVSAAGCVKAGETSAQAAQREIFEELGIKIDLTNMHPQLSVSFENGFDDIYMVQLDGTIDIDELNLQFDEVLCARWASLREIEEMLHRGIFIPYYENLLRLMFDMKDSYGCFSVNHLNTAQPALR